MSVSPIDQNLSVGVHMPTNIDLCRRILTGVRSACEARGLSMHLLSDSGLITEANAEIMSKIPPLVGIVAHISSPKEFALLQKYSPNVVGTSNRTLCKNPRVINDEMAIGEMGAKYLLSLNLRHLVVLHKTNMRYSKERRDAFMTTAERAGAKVQSIKFRGRNELKHIAEEVLKMPPPVGLMTESDHTARAFIENLPDYRKVVPHQIAVLGVDDDSLQNTLSPISLSSVRLGGHEIGIHACSQLLHLHQGRSISEAPLLIRPIRVVERASTNIMTVNDPLVIRAIRHMRDDISNIGNVADLVAALQVNRRTLEIRFRKALNRSIANEMTHVRLAKARQLLESTDLNINEIAELVGYPEYRLLTLAFQRLTGEPPTAYRKRAKEEMHFGF